MAGNGSLQEILASCLSPENLRRTQAEAALKVNRSYLTNDVALASHLIYPIRVPHDSSDAEYE